MTSPRERLLDILVFAPTGLALTLAEELPELVEKGKNRIEGRAATARVVGQFAVQMGCREISKRAKQVLDGQLPGSMAAPRAARVRAATPARRVRPEPEHAADVPRAPAFEPAPAFVSSNGKADSDHLGIPAYDTLSASQVVKRLAGLSQNELLDVADHERANRHRATILNRVEQLLSEQSHDST